MPAPSALRKDAQRNRQLLLAAASEVFAERGLDGSLDEIARRAGVGNATLYRRFPTRESLYEAVFADLRDSLVHIDDEVADIEDSWDALVRYLMSMLTRFAQNQGAAEVIAGMDPDTGSFAELRTHLRGSVDRLLRRAQADGQVRADITAVDVLTVTVVAQRLVNASETAAPQVWPRAVALMLDGLRASSAAAGLPGSPITVAERDRVLEEMHRRR